MANPTINTTTFNVPTLGTLAPTFTSIIDTPNGQVRDGGFTPTVYNPPQGGQGGFTAQKVYASGGSTVAPDNWFKISNPS